MIGFLFGLGFDTATTIGLLVMTTAASLAGVSPLALIALPLAFTAAMTLCDSLNGVAMMRMYRSALDDPRRKLGFNAAVTGISAVSALFIAAITLGGFIERGLRTGGPGHELARCHRPRRRRAIAYRIAAPLGRG